MPTQLIINVHIGKIDLQAGKRQKAMGLNYMRS